MIDQLLQEWEALTADLVWQPHPANRPQVQAYLSDAFETLYGGAAGGGKSQLGLGLARTMHGRSLLIRRTFPELERSLIADSMRFYGDSKFYNSSKHVWKVDGREIEFGHMEQIGIPDSPKDEGKYASAAYDFVFVDQVEQFTEYGYSFLFSRVRSADRKRKRIMASANPVGEGIEWIMRRWSPWLVDKTAKPGEIKWYYQLTGDEIGEREAPNGAPIWDAKANKGKGDYVTPLSRTFIPAGLNDNPYLGDDYKSQLQLLPPELRDALLYGDWSAMLTDDAYQVIPRAWVKAAQARWQPREETADVIGCDVARGGDDKTVKAPRKGSYFMPLEKYPGRSTPDGQSVADLLAGNAVINIDVIGIGSSAYDIGRERGLKITPVNFAEKSIAKDKSETLRFINKRAEYYWAFREALDPVEGDDIALPPDPELEADLCAPRWQSMSNGIKIESKEDIKKRIGRSPDCADAVVLSWGGAPTWYMI
jgi:hypothetical protein